MKQRARVPWSVVARFPYDSVNSADITTCYRLETIEYKVARILGLLAAVLMFRSDSVSSRCSILPCLVPTGFGLLPLSYCKWIQEECLRDKLFQGVLLRWRRHCPRLCSQQATAQRSAQMPIDRAVSLSSLVGACSFIQPVYAGCT